MRVPRVLLAIAFLAMLLGITFRFTHLDRKVYWGDEIYSSIRMLGETEADLVARAATLRDAHALWLVLHPTDAGGSSDPLALARVLAIEEPHHTPVYYELAHFWVAAFGNSIVTTRSLSAWLSLLALPCAFWLAKELFPSPRAPWIAVALLSLSPVAVLYAQQAREYALWMVAIIALEAALLRALRRDDRAAWAVFAACEAVALYVHLLSAFLIGGLAIYALIAHRGEPAKLRRCALAFVIGGAAFVPWLVFLFRGFSAVTGSLRTTFEASSSPTDVVRSFLGALRLAIIDLDWVTSSATAATATGAAIVLIGIGLTGLIRHQPRRSWMFVVVVLLATTLPLVVPDLITHGQRVRDQRYLIPALIAVDFIFVGWLSFLTESMNATRAFAGYAMLVGLLAAGTVSCAVSSTAETWWSTQLDNSISVARAVNRSPHPLLTSDGYLLYMLALANYVDPRTQIVLWPRCYECSDVARSPDLHAIDARRFDTLYAVGPSPNLQQLLGAYVRQHARVSYTCINVRRNCPSDLNIEPIVTKRPG